MRSHDGREIKRSWVIAWIGVGIMVVATMFLWI